MTEPTANERDETSASEPTGSKRDETAASDPSERVKSKHSASAGPGAVVRWLSAAALVVALAALGAGVWALLRTSSSNSPAPPPSAQQIADAKTKACGAYKTASAAVKSNNNADPGSEPKAAAANARLALVLAHFYLLERLDPATPAPLADAIRKYADNLEESMILVLGGAAGDDPAVSGRVQELEPLNNQIIELCK